MAVAKENKIVRGNDLTYIGQQIKANFVAKDGSKVLSTNDYTTAEKNKLAGIAAGAEVNVNADWNAASGDAQILNKPTIPTKTSDLTNDSGFITTSDIPEGAAASTTTPLMDGTAAVGTELAFARGDHRHPSDTSKANVANPQFTGTASVKATAAATERLSLNPSQASLNYLTSGENEVALVFPSNVTGDIDITLPNRQGTLALNSDIPAPATANPNMDGTAAVGSSAKYAKEDHVHPSDTSKANVASPTFTGAVTISLLDKTITIHPDGLIEMEDGSSSPAQTYEVTLPQGSFGDVLATENYVTTAIANKANVNNPQFTGSLTIGGSGNQSVEITNFGELIYAVGSNENSVRLPDNTDLDDVIATQSYVSTAVSNKANKSTTLAGYGITNAYTKTEVDTAISNALKGGYVVVATLPTASADTLGKIYLVPMTDTEASNVKEEYVTWLDGSTYKWEKLGTTQFDNSDYEERLTAAEITTLLNL